MRCNGGVYLCEGLMVWMRPRRVHFSLCLWIWIWIDCMGFGLYGRLGENLGDTFLQSN